MDERPFYKIKRRCGILEKEKIIEDLLKNYERTCLVIAKNILHNDEDAKEILNDALLSLWKTDFLKLENPGAYLCKIVRNLALNRLTYLSAEKRGNGNLEIALSELEECFPSKISVEEKIEETAFKTAVEDFLRNQPKEKQNIFVLRYWYMYSVLEISKTYGMSESKVKSVLFRMRKELRKKLEKEDFI